MTTRRLSTSLGALGILAALVVVIPTALAWSSRARFGTANPLGGVGVPWSSGGDVTDSLQRPVEDDTVLDLILRISLLAAWVAVLVLVLTIVLETVHLVRHRNLPSPRRRGLGWAQPVAHFVASGLVALLPLTESAPAIGLGTPPTPAEHRVVASSFETQPTVFGADAGATLDAPADAADGPADPSTLHVVERGESVWSIAAALGDGSEPSTLYFAERILDLNLGEAMLDGETFTNPALIRPGWKLLLPASVLPGADTTAAANGHAMPPSRPTVQHTTVTVAPGDTLWSIASEHLGDPDRWRVIAAANLGRTMIDGLVFDDPDVILPGWQLLVPVRAGHGTFDIPDDHLDVADATPTFLPPPIVADHLDRPSTNGDRPEHGDTDAATELRPPSLPPPAEPASPSGASRTTTTTVAPAAWETPDPDDVQTPPRASSPSTLGWEHAGALAAGLLVVTAARRRRHLRAARSRARLPEPTERVADVERTLRSVTVGERAARFDVAIRAAAAALLGSGIRPMVAIDGDDGSIDLVLTGPAEHPPSWEGDPQRWHLPASVPLETLAETARTVEDPCPTLVAVGRAEHGVVLVDPEAVRAMQVAAPAETADAVLTSMTVAIATSLGAETAHLVTVGIDPAAGVGHRNAVGADDADGAVATATALVGSTTDHELDTFELRSRRTGGEAWEPAVIVVGSNHAADVPWQRLPRPGHGIAVLTAGSVPQGQPVVRLEHADDTWTMSAAGWMTEMVPYGLEPEQLAALDEFVTHADRPAVVLDDPADDTPTDPSLTDPMRDDHHDHVGDHVAGRVDPELWDALHVPATGPDVAAAGAHDGTRTPDRPVAIIVHVYGGVTITDGAGGTHPWQKSKSVELIAWLATHRTRATRTAARHAMWTDEVRNATFSNVVSEARRGLAELVPPADGAEWILRTMNEDLRLDPAVATDVEVVRMALDAARRATHDEAIEHLRPAVALIDGAPFAGSTYAWPDADGLVTDATLLATTACTELARHALSVGDTDLVFDATSRALSVLPGHEESIALRLRAHAARGDAAGVRAEWQSYERTLVADPWSDGEPSPDLVDLRQRLLPSS